LRIGIVVDVDHVATVALAKVAGIFVIDDYFEVSFCLAVVAVDRAVEKNGMWWWVDNGLCHD